MSKTYILGAGFSKAVANGPILKDLWSYIENARLFEEQRPDVPKKFRRHRIDWFDELDDFLNNIEEEAKKRFINIKDQSLNITTQLRENLEYLFTLIDLHANAPNIIFNKPNVDIKSYPLIPLQFTSRNQLRKISGILSLYLYLVFVKLKNSQLSWDFAKKIQNNDNLITFNYDLVLEKLLMNREKWYPYKGYVGVHQFEYEDDEEELKEKDLTSTLKIHKLHGSINWRTKDLLEKFNSIDEVLIVMDNLEEQGFYFNDLLDRKPETSQGFYVGLYSPKIIHPSFFKPLQYREFFEIWRSAINVISKSEELIVIGYSFRPEDTNAYLLLSNINRKSQITIVDIDSENIKEKIKSLGFENIKCVNSIEEFMQN